MFSSYYFIGLVSLLSITFLHAKGNTCYLLSNNNEGLKRMAQNFHEWLIYNKFPDIYNINTRTEINDQKYVSRFIQDSRILFRFVAPDGARYPCEIEKSALAYSGKDICFLVKMWLSIMDMIEKGQSPISDHAAEKYKNYAKNCALFWMQLGAMQNNALCHYYLACHYADINNNKLRDIHAYLFINLSENKTEFISIEEYIFLIRCYLNGWGCETNESRAKEIYQIYQCEALENNISPVKWNSFIDK